MIIIDYFLTNLNSMFEEGNNGIAAWLGDFYTIRGLMSTFNAMEADDVVFLIMAKFDVVTIASWAAACRNRLKGDVVCASPFQILRLR